MSPNNKPLRKVANNCSKSFYDKYVRRLNNGECILFVQFERNCPLHEDCNPTMYLDLALAGKLNVDVYLRRI